MNRTVAGKRRMTARQAQVNPASETREPAY